MPELDAQWENDGELVTFPMPPAETFAEKIAWLSRTLGVRTRFVRFVPDTGDSLF